MQTVAIVQFAPSAFYRQGWGGYNVNVIVVFIEM